MCTFMLFTVILNLFSNLINHHILQIPMYIVITIFIIFLALFLSVCTPNFKLGQFYAIVFILKLLLLSKKILEIISANRQSLINIWEVQVFPDWDWCKKLLL